MKKFNSTGSCIPERHYMVDISGKIKTMRGYIDEGAYFTINRPRQFGKTTVLYLLEKLLINDYLIFSISFEGMGDDSFNSVEKFFRALVSQMLEALSYNHSFLADNHEVSAFMKESAGLASWEELHSFITVLTVKAGCKTVLMIDEVDKASNYSTFMNFLGLLRNKYLKREQGKDSTFHSVVLAGIHDIKNIKRKIRPDETAEYNSPWNIAIDFEVDLGFNPGEISTLLLDYQKEQELELETVNLSRIIYDYTGGYPYLVSKLCHIVDVKLNKEFTEENMQKAFDMLVNEQNNLFDDLIKNLEQHQDLAETVFSIIIGGIKYDYNSYAFAKGITYGIFGKDTNNKIKIHNQVFELVLYNYLIARTQLKRNEIISYNYRDIFINEQNDVDMETVLLSFQKLMKHEYRHKDTKFIEREARLIFLAFLKPIINGNGFYFVEPRTRMDNRMDIVVTFNNKMYIIELKIWSGEKNRQKSYQQLARYLSVMHQSKGYMIHFNFNKNKEYISNNIEFQDKRIFEVIV